MADRRELRTDFVAHDVNTAKTIDDIGDKADHAADQLDEMARAGQGLDAQMAETQGAIKDLAREIDRTGDLSLFKKLKAEERNLKKILSVREILGDEEEQRRAGDDVSRNLFGRLARSAGEAGIKAGAALGAAMPGGIGRGLQAAGPQVSTAIVGGLAGVVAAAAPLLGATVSAALLGGVGAAGLGGGIALAFQDPKIKAAASGLGEHVKGSLVDAADSFRGATLGAIGILGASFDRMRPRIQRIFEGLAPQVENIAAGLAGAFEKALPGIETASQASGAIFDALAESLPQLGHHIGEFFADISKGSTGAGQAVRALVDIVGAMLDVMAPILVGLSKTFEWTNKLFGFWQKDGGNTKKAIQDLKDAFKEFGQETAVAVSQGANAAEQGMRLAAESADELAGAVENLNELMQRQADKNLTAAEAALRYRDSLNEAKDAIDKKKKVNREEEEALIGLARRSNSLSDAWVKNGETGDGLAKKQATLRADFIKTARQMGYTQSQAEALADRYLAIPKNVNTKVKADTAAALAAIRFYQRAINQLRGKTVTIHTRFTSSGQHKSGGIGSGTQIAGASTGGPIFGPGPKGVDSELRRLAPGEHVLTAEDVDAMGGQQAVLGWRRQLHGGSAPPARASRTGEGWSETALYRAFLRALQELPILRLPNDAMTANQYHRGG